MKKLLLIQLLALSAYSEQLTITNKDEIVAVQRVRMLKVKQEAFVALQNCNDTNAIAKATATMEATIPKRENTNSATIIRQPPSRTPQ